MLEGKKNAEYGVLVLEPMDEKRNVFGSRLKLGVQMHKFVSAFDLFLLT